MSRYTDAVCRVCRREGMKLYLKGDRCYTDKCAIERRSYPPGQHRVMKRKQSNFSLQLREKQKVRFIYGIQEKQFGLTFNRAEKMKGATGINFIALLERRLDNVVYRLGFANSRAEARQLVEHGHFNVDGKKVTIPSLTLKKGQVIALRRQSEKVKQALEASGKRERPVWLDLNASDLQGIIKELPTREDVTIPIEEKLIVEFYSR